MGQFLIAFEPVILVLHFIVALFLIAVILLQSGKGSDIGTAFGVGNSQALLGTTGAPSLLTKLTAFAAMMFLATSLSLATTSKYASKGGSSGSGLQNELTKDDGKNMPITPETK